MRYVLFRINRRSKIIDASTGLGVAGVLLRIFSKSEGRQLETSVTGNTGSSSFSVPDGNYQIGIYKPGYRISQNTSKIMDFNKGLLDVTIKNGRLSENILIIHT